MVLKVVDVDPVIGVEAEQQPDIPRRRIEVNEEEDNKQANWTVEQPNQRQHAITNANTGAGHQRQNSIDSGANKQNKQQPLNI